MKKRLSKKMYRGKSSMLEKYCDRRGKYRWRIRDPDNYNIIGASTQGYTNAHDRDSNLGRLMIVLAEILGYDIISVDE